MITPAKLLADTIPGDHGNTLDWRLFNLKAIFGFVHGEAQSRCINPVWSLHKLGNLLQRQLGMRGSQEILRQLGLPALAFRHLFKEITGKWMAAI